MARPRHMLSPALWVVVAMLIPAVGCDGPVGPLTGPGREIGSTPSRGPQEVETEGRPTTTPQADRGAEALLGRPTATPTPARGADGLLGRPTPTPARGADGPSQRPTPTPATGGRFPSTENSSGQPEAPREEGFLLFLTPTPTPLPTFGGSPADLAGRPAPIPDECREIVVGGRTFGAIPCRVPVTGPPYERAPSPSGGQQTETEAVEATVPRYFDHFEATATSHSWANSYLLALASDYVYECALCEDDGGASEEWFESTFKAWGMERIDFVDKKTFISDTQAVVMSNSSAVIVVFRGTEQTVNDFITDGVFSVVPVPVWSGGLLAAIPMVHAGFYNAQFQVYAEVKALIDSHMGPGKTLWITGHSLGAALATMVAYNLEKVDGVAVRGVYTYGSPRAGDMAWAGAYDNMLFGWSLSNPSGTFPHLTLGAKTHRWVNNADVIPTLPWVATGYRHVGTKNTIYADGSIGINDPGPIIAVASVADHFGYPAKIYAQLPSALKPVMPPPPLQ